MPGQNSSRLVTNVHWLWALRIGLHKHFFFLLNMLHIEWASQVLSSLSSVCVSLYYIDFWIDPLKVGFHCPLFLMEI